MGSSRNWGWKIACGLALWSGLGTAFAAGTLSCKYTFDSLEMATVTLTVGADGLPGPQASCTMGIGTPPHQETVTPVALGPGEKVHLWLSKESADNSVELVVYSTPQPKGESKLVNPHVPYAQEIWGSCSSMRSE